MPNITLGAHTFEVNPGGTDGVLMPEKTCAVCPTFNGVGYFSWGASIIGKQIVLTWPWMTAAEFNTIRDLLVADLPVVFDPADGSGVTYNVEIMNLHGTYHCGLTANAGIYRKNVKITILILSVVEV